MIRVYAAVLSRDSPLPDVTRLTSSYRKVTIKLILNKDTREFYITIEGTDGTDYCFKVKELTADPIIAMSCVEYTDLRYVPKQQLHKVPGNVRTVDRCNTASGLVRVGFVSPNLDLVIYGNAEDLEAFVYTVEAVREPTLPLPPECSDRTHKRRLSCICYGPRFPQYKRFHRIFYCPVSVSITMCAICCYRLLESYNDDDARKIINTWKSGLGIDACQSGGHMSSVSVTSYPYLRILTVQDLGLVEIPEQLGSLPCLEHLNLSHNRLGQAKNWNWLNSPFLRENLNILMLNNNELSVIPEPVVKLRNLKNLNLSFNILTELPATLGNVKNLRELDISINNLIILPGWMYRKEVFRSLYTDRNCFGFLCLTEYHKPQLNQHDFKTVSVPSLFETVVKYIITERVAYWEYNVPSTSVNLLEAAYLCRCGSVLFPNSGGRDVQCRIEKKALAEYYDDNDDDDHKVPVVLHLCSYKCYKLIEPFIICRHL